MHRVTGRVRLEKRILPGRRSPKKLRHVVRERQIAKERFLPEPRHPTVIDTVAVGAIFRLPARRAGKIVEQRRIDTMTPESEFGFVPATAFHVIGPHHDFIDVLHSEIRVVEAALTVESREGEPSIQQQQIMMVDGAVRPQIGTVALLHIRYAKSEPFAHELVRALEARYGEHYMLDCFRACSFAPFAMRIQAIDRTGGIENVRRAYDRALAKHPQRHGKPAVGEKMHRAVRIRFEVPVPCEISTEFAQVLWGIDAPDHLT